MAEPSAKRRFVHAVRERRERHRERNRIIRIAVAMVGFLIVLVGLALIPLPGPGLLVTAVGLAILALEFAWAERLLERTVDKIEDAGETVRKASPLQQVLLALGLALGGVAAIAIAIAWDVPFLPV
jgi:uncharacterized protein (TIGR02611 family)